MRPGVYPRAKRLLAAASVVALGALVTASHEKRAEACFLARPEHTFVRIADEVALVTYDPATKTEHFVRRATFESTASDFGFLVPVPSTPTLTEAPADLLQRVELLTRPKIVYSEKLSGIDPTPLLLLSLSRSKSVSVGSAPEEVRVLDAVQVAGFDAVVLEADSAQALAAWLESHHYAKGPETEAWLAPYVQKHWKLAAFRMAAPAGAGADPGSAEKRFGSGAVDIAFQTETPFYPYREPDSMRGPNAKGQRSLAVFFIGPERVGGTVGETATWNGLPTYAKRLDEDLSGVAGASKGRVLSAFVDRSSPRPGTDEVYFRKAPVQDDLVPPPIEITLGTKVPVPIDVVLVLGGGLVLVGRAIRKRRERQDGP